MPITRREDQREALLIRWQVFVDRGNLGHELLPPEAIGQPLRKLRALAFAALDLRVDADEPREARESGRWQERLEQRRQRQATGEDNTHERPTESVRVSCEKSFPPNGAGCEKCRVESGHEIHHRVVIEERYLNAT